MGHPLTSTLPAPNAPHSSGVSIAFVYAGPMCPSPRLPPRRLIPIAMLLAGAAAPAPGQEPQWVQRSVSGPGARASAAVAFDSARGVTVLFGGGNGTGVLLGDTWEYDGTSWTRRLASGPTPRAEAKMAYDSHRGVCVLFGGADILGHRNDTWEWDGAAWSQRMVTGPLARAGHAALYDSLRRRVLIQGGWSGGHTIGDMWTLTSTGWAQTGGISTPPYIYPFLYYQSGSYDASRDRVVLFGGWDGAGLPSNRTYFFNGTWLPELAGPVSARGLHAAVYDSTRGVTVLFGGRLSSDLADTWRLRDRDWTQLPISGPSPRNSHAMAYDSERKRTVLFGGRHDSVFYNDTWELILPVPCYANCDDSTTPPILNVADFVCFQIAFAAGDPLANCDGSTIAPILNVADFICFQSAFAAGCP